jgi:hypothetical protein
MVMKVPGGWQFGNNPPTTKEKAEEQMRAAYANGWKGPGRESDKQS